MMKMKSCPPGLFLVLFLCGLASGLGSVLSRGFTLLPYSSTWQEAQTLCRSSFSDLAVIYEQSVADSLQLQPYFPWVDLCNTMSSDQRSHGSSCPNACGYWNYYTKGYNVSDCGFYHFFICFNIEHDQYTYTFINTSRTWSDAQQYCEQFYGGLLGKQDRNQQNQALQLQDFPVWTGLYRDGETWTWSSGVSDYRNWAQREPGNTGGCVAIYSLSKTMIAQNCSTRYPFLCFKDNLLVVKQNKSWEEALEYCRAFKAPNRGPYQLVSVQPGDDYSYMMNRVMEADTDEVWTGLRYLAGSWFWANRAGMLLPDLPRCPTGQHCGVFSKNSNGSLETRDCLEQKNFLCYSQW